MISGLEAAAILGCADRTVRTWQRRGILRTVKSNGHKRLYFRSECERIAERGLSEQEIDTLIGHKPKKGANRDQHITPSITLGLKGRSMNALVRHSVSWFSAGVSSAVATRLAIDEIDEVFYIHIDDQHPDTLRFVRECEAWFGKVKKQPPDLTAGEFNRREC